MSVVAINSETAGAHSAKGDAQMRGPAPSPVIIIDPGHGGKDPGALGTSRLKEKDVVLSMSKQLAASLRKEAGARVYLTRPDDRFITLGERDRIANAKSCDLFLSVHANASVNKKAEGMEIYYLNRASDEASKRLETRENAGEPRPEKEIDAIVSDLIQAASTEESAELAGRVRKLVQARVQKKFRIEDVKVKTALFYVLVGAKCPSLLIETGFITHPKEGKRLKDKGFQKALGEAIAKGVAAHLKANADAEGDL